MLINMKKIMHLNIILLILILINFIVFRIYTNIVKTKDIKVDNNIQDTILEKNVLKSYTSYLYQDETGNLYTKNYNNHNEIDIESIIKEDNIDDFNNKIEELLKLKYPEFIVNDLLSDGVEREFLIRSNELVIYFNNYSLAAEFTDLLYLKVNYNEIKDWLNFTVILDSEYENEDGFKYTNSKKSIAITFDDSPNKNKTTRLLDILNVNKAHATFFVVGNKINNSNKDILINMKSNGNEIGSHTYAHKSMKKMTNEEIINDFNKMNSIYQNIFNTDLKLIRPPYGSYKKNMLNLIPASFILWSLDTNDWRYHNSEQLVNYVLDNVKDGDIILFHDSYNSTIDAIEKLLPLLYLKGYQVMSVSELFAIKNQELEMNKVYHKAS